MNASDHSQPVINRADIRSDFIRRLFAVAISVGFAAALVKMRCVEEGRWPAPFEWGQLAVLFMGLSATVLSWDGYLASISRRPLKRPARFVIDIALVFIYMLLLITSSHAGFWLPILTFIFFLYVVWDALSVREYLSQYDAALAGEYAGAEQSALCIDVAKVYWRGFFTQAGTSRGPIATLTWFVFFLALTIMARLKMAAYEEIILPLFACGALWLYRRDKSIEAGQIRGYSTLKRISITIGLFVCVVCYLYLMPNAK